MRKINYFCTAKFRAEIFDMAKKETKPAEQAPAVNIEEALNRSEQFFNKNKKIIFISLIALIVIIAGGMLYKSKVVAPRETKASAAMFLGETYFVNGDFATALAGDGVDFVGFEEIADMYSNTKAGKLANAYAGLCCAQLDSFEVAAQYLAKFKGNDEMASPAILGALANCYAQMEDLNQAAATFEKAAKVADNALLSPYYLFQAALVYESLKNPAKALKLYNSIKFDYPNSKEAQTIEQYITRISSK